VLSIAICNIFKLYQAPHNIKIVGVIPSVRITAPCRLSCHTHCCFLCDPCLSLHDSESSVLLRPT
jgi:hypothetical protein